MGVKKLFQLLEEKRDKLQHTIPLNVCKDYLQQQHQSSTSTSTATSTSTSSTATRVLVDGYSFVIQFAEALYRGLETDLLKSYQPQDQNNLPDYGTVSCFFYIVQSFWLTDADIVGQDLDTISQFLDMFLDVLYSVYGLEQLIFAFDAPRGIDDFPTNNNNNAEKKQEEEEAEKKTSLLRAKELRLQIQKKRELERQQVSKAHHRYAFGLESFKSNRAGGRGSQFSLPPLFFGAVRDILHSRRDRGVQVVSLSTEVDDVVGTLVKRFNANLIFTSDTDFVINPLSSSVDVVMLQFFPFKKLLQQACNYALFGSIEQQQAESGFKASSSSSPSAASSPSSRIELSAFSAASLIRYLKIDSVLTNNNNHSKNNKKKLNCEGYQKEAEHLYLALAASFSSNDITQSCFDEGRIDQVAVKMFKDEDLVQLIIEHARQIAMTGKIEPYSASNVIVDDDDVDDNNSNQEDSKHNEEGENDDEDEDEDESEDDEDIESMMNQQNSNNNNKKKKKKKKNKSSLSEKALHPLVQQSVCSYLLSSRDNSSSSPTSQAVAIADPLSYERLLHELKIRHLYDASSKPAQDELRSFLDAYFQNSLSSEHLILLLHDSHYPGVTPFPPSFPAFHDSVTARHILKQVRKTLASSRARIQGEPTSEPTWLELTKSPAQDKINYVHKALGGVEVRSFLEAVLLVAAPQLHREEIPILCVVSLIMQMLSPLSVSSPSAVPATRETFEEVLCDIYEYAAEEGILEERPDARVLELAYIFTQSYASVSSLVNLLSAGGGGGTENNNNNNNSATSAASSSSSSSSFGATFQFKNLKPPQSSHFFSGNLLFVIYSVTISHASANEAHLLNAKKSLAWLYEASQTFEFQLAESFFGVIEKVTDLLETTSSFPPPAFARLQQQSEGGKKGGRQEKSQVADEEGSLFLTFKKPPSLSSRFSTRWIGVLHRDELVDMLDASETAVEEGGRYLELQGGGGGSGTKKINSGANRSDYTNLSEQLLPSSSVSLVQDLPVAIHMERILATIATCNCVTIHASTGSGKTTLIPLMVMLSDPTAQIIVTSPRRVAATSVAKRCASLLGEEVGEQVGYRIGGGREFHRDGPRTRLRFVTTTYLLESCVAGNSALFKKATHIILDEAHERQLSVDFLCAILKRMLQENEEQEKKLEQEQQQQQQSSKTGRDESSKKKKKSTHKTLPDDLQDEEAIHIDEVEENHNNNNNQQQQRAGTMMIQQKKIVVMSATVQAELFSNYFLPLASKLPPFVISSMEAGTFPQTPQDQIFVHEQYQQQQQQQEEGQQQQENEQHKQKQYRRFVPTITIDVKLFPVNTLYLDEFLDKFSTNLPSLVGKTLQQYLAKIKVLEKQAQKLISSPSTSSAAATSAASSSSSPSSSSSSPAVANLTPPQLRGEMIQGIADVILLSIIPGSSIAVFLPGLEELEGVLSTLTTHSQKLRHSRKLELRVHILHSIVDIAEQNKIIEPVSNSECKIVLATNILETSLTIPDLSVVIDAGAARRMQYDNEKNMRAIATCFASKSSAKQRAGRVGRTRPGTVIRLYTEKLFQLAFPPFDPSELQPLEYSLLQVRSTFKDMAIEKACKLLLEPPPERAVRLAIANLVRWGALAADEGHELLELGKISLSLPIDVMFTRALLTAASFGCVTEMIIVISGISNPRSLFVRPLRNFFDSDYEFVKAVSETWKTRLHFNRNLDSDLTCFLAIYEELAPVYYGRNHFKNYSALFAECANKHSGQLAPRAVQTFFKFITQVAASFLQHVERENPYEHSSSTHHHHHHHQSSGNKQQQQQQGRGRGFRNVSSVQLQPDDLRRLILLAEKPSEMVKEQLPALHDFSSQLLLQNVLASTAEITVTLFSRLNAVNANSLIQEAQDNDDLEVQDALSVNELSKCVCFKKLSPEAMVAFGCELEDDKQNSLLDQYEATLQKCFGCKVLISFPDAREVMLRFSDSTTNNKKKSNNNNNNNNSNNNNNNDKPDVPFCSEEVHSSHFALTAIQSIQRLGNKKVTVLPLLAPGEEVPEHLSKSRGLKVNVSNTELSATDGITMPNPEFFANYAKIGQNGVSKALSLRYVNPDNAALSSGDGTGASGGFFGVDDDDDEDSDFSDTSSDSDYDNDFYDTSDDDDDSSSDDYFNYSMKKKKKKKTNHRNNNSNMMIKKKAELGVVETPAVLDRWSALAAVPNVSLAPPFVSLAFAFTPTLVGANKNLSLTNLFSSSQNPYFSFLTAMNSNVILSKIDRVCAFHSSSSDDDDDDDEYNSNYRHELQEKKKQNKNKNRNSSSTLKPVKSLYVSLIRDIDSKEIVITQLNPQWIETTTGGPHRPMSENPGERINIHDPARKFSIKYLAAPLHVLIEVNICRVLHALSSRPHQFSAEKALLLSLLRELTDAQGKDPTQNDLFRTSQSFRDLFLPLQGGLDPRELTGGKKGKKNKNTKKKQNNNKNKKKKKSSSQYYEYSSDEDDSDDDLVDLGSDLETATPVSLPLIHLSKTVRLHPTLSHLEKLNVYVFDLADIFDQFYDVEEEKKNEVIVDDSEEEEDEGRRKKLPKLKTQALRKFNDIFQRDNRAHHLSVKTPTSTRTKLSVSAPSFVTASPSAATSAASSSFLSNNQQPSFLVAPRSQQQQQQQQQQTSSSINWQTTTTSPTTATATSSLYVPPPSQAQQRHHQYVDPFAPDPPKSQKKQQEKKNNNNNEKNQSSSSSAPAAWGEVSYS